MSGDGGARYWNEETQRWEDDTGLRNAPAPATPPPLPSTWPGTAPVWPPAAGTTGGADDTEVADAGAGLSAGPASGAGGSPAASGSPAAVPAESASPLSGPPGAPPESADRPVSWHGPAAPGSGDVGGGVWPATWVTGGDPAPSGAETGGTGPWPPATDAPWPGTTWPPGDQLTSPVTPTRGMSRRLVWSVLVGAAVVGVAVSLVLTLVVGGGDDEAEGAGATSPPASTGEVSQQNDPSATPTEESASPTVPSLELPAGYEEYEDTEGFRIAMPEGWSRSTVASQYGIAVVNYRSADSERRLQVYQVSEESPDASFDLYLSEGTAKAKGFEELDLQNLDDAEFTGSRLEYLADTIKGEPDIGTWHVYDERFVGSDGNIYAIAAYGADADGREDELELLTTALEWFCPPYASCDPATID